MHLPKLTEAAEDVRGRIRDSIFDAVSDTLKGEKLSFNKANGYPFGTGICIDGVEREDVKALRAKLSPIISKVQVEGGYAVQVKYVGEEHILAIVVTKTRQPK